MNRSALHDRRVALVAALRRAKNIVANEATQARQTAAGYRTSARRQGEHYLGRVATIDRAGCALAAALAAFPKDPN